MINKIVCSIIAIIYYIAFTLSAEEHVVHVKNADLYCVSEGEGTPILILHGGAGFLTHDYLRPHFDQLSNNHRIVYYDQRGIGKSTGNLNPEEINLLTYIEDIEAIRSSLGAEKIVILGHSWGSFLGLHYAIAHPDRIEKMILTASMPAGSDELYPFFAELARRTAPFKEALFENESSDSYKAGDPLAVQKQNVLILQTYLYNPQIIDRLNFLMTQEANLKGFKIWEIFKQTIFMQPYNLHESLRSVSCPALIIHGDYDVIPFESAVKINKSLPNSKLIKMEQCGHFPFVEQKELFFEAIDNFLDK